MGAANASGSYIWFKQSSKLTVSSGSIALEAVHSSKRHAPNRNIGNNHIADCTGHARKCHSCTNNSCVVTKRKPSTPLHNRNCIDRNEVAAGKQTCVSDAQMRRYLLNKGKLLEFL